MCSRLIPSLGRIQELRSILSPTDSQAKFQVSPAPAGRPHSGGNFGREHRSGGLQAAVEPRARNQNTSAWRPKPRSRHRWPQFPVLFTDHCTTVHYSSFGLTQTPASTGPIRERSFRRLCRRWLLDVDPGLGRACHRPRWIIAEKASASAFSSELALIRSYPENWVKNNL